MPTQTRLQCWTTPAGTSLSGMSDTEAIDLLVALDHAATLRDGAFNTPIIDLARVMLRRALGDVLPANHAPIVAGPPTLRLTPLGPVDVHDGHAEAEAMIGRDE